MAVSLLPLALPVFIAIVIAVVVVDVIIPGNVISLAAAEDSLQSYIVLFSDRPPASAVFPDRSRGGGASVPSADAESSFASVSTDVNSVQANSAAATAQAQARYASTLVARHDSVLSSASIPAVRKVQSFSQTLNGFAAKLTAAEAQRLRNAAGVARVRRSRTFRSRTISTPQFLGLPDSLWQQGGGEKLAGDNVVIGILDSGIWPEHPSFASDKNYAHIRITRPQFNGKCSSMPQEFTGNGSLCGPTKKIVSANVFNSGLYAEPRLRELISDYESPRDMDGHGTFVASVAAGSAGVPVSVLDMTSFDNSTAIGSVSGIAPRARLAVYKVMWAMQEGGGAIGSEIDFLAAVEQAMVDGVNVMCISAGPTDGTVAFFDPLAISLLYAAQQGIFVSMAAGNSGPSPYSIENMSPWVTTAAASSHNRAYTKRLVLGSSITYNGVFLSPGVGNLTSKPRIVLGFNVALPGMAVQAQVCKRGALNETLVSGRIVVCRQDPYQTYSDTPIDPIPVVRALGGVGVVLLVEEMSMVDPFAVYTFPFIGIAPEDTLSVYAFVNGNRGTATASISPSDVDYAQRAPSIVDFSSRGPITNLTRGAPVNPQVPVSSNDVAKPDVAAPGFAVWAAISPAPGASGALGQMFGVESGTSVAAPHIAGIAALLVEQRPDWTPSMIKSAILTTASATDSTGAPIPLSTTQSSLGANINGGSQANLFDMGSGQANPPALAFGPGLVYPADFNDYLAFLYTLNRTLAAEAVGGVPWPDRNRMVLPRNLNLPNVAVGNLTAASAVVVNRRVQSVSAQRLVYRAEVVEPYGVRVTVNSSTLTLRPGQLAFFTITFKARPTTPASPFRSGYQYGSLTWVSGPYRVRSLIAVRRTG